MKNTIRPLHDVLLVKRQESEPAKGLIHIPEEAREKSIFAEVLAVGPGDRSKTGVLLPVDVKVGDVVLLTKYAGTGQELTVDGQKLLLVRSGDVQAVVGPTDTSPPVGDVADLLEAAWGVIANAGGGDWTQETPEWAKGAGEWRDRYFEWQRNPTVERQLADALAPYAPTPPEGGRPEGPVATLKRFLAERDQFLARLHNTAA